MARPGWNSTLDFKNDSHSVSLKIEPHVGARDGVIDMSGEMVFSKGKGKLLEWKSWVTLLSGKKEIVSSFQKDGKWYVLVVEVKVEEMIDWLLGK